MTLASALLVATLLAPDTAAPPAAAPPAAAPPAAAPPAAAPPAAEPSAGSKNPAAPSRKGRPPPLPPASLPTVEGEIVEADHRAHRLRLRTAEGEVVLGFDRNTLLRGPAGAITPLQLSQGARVKAGRDGEARAAWVELKPSPSTPKAAP